MSDQRFKEQFRRNAQTASAVAAPAAVTAPVAVGANPTKAEFDALRQDVVNLRATVDALRTSFRDAGLLS